MTKRGAHEITVKSMVDRVSMSIMESEWWHSSGDLKCARMVAENALETLAPLEILAKLLTEHAETVTRQQNLKDFDEIWPI
jgi:hypothetical protein